MENIFKYSKESAEEFFKRIETLRCKNQFLAAIKALESIPKEERDYRICCELVDVYQLFWIIGENEEEPDYDIGMEMLEQSLLILNSIREEGKDKAEWNMLMARGYYYLEEEDEAIPYAVRWNELEPSNENTLELLEDCKKAIQHKEIVCKVYDIVEEILKNYKITSKQDYARRDDKESDEIDEKIYLATKDYGLYNDEIIDIILNVLEDLEYTE